MDGNARPLSQDKETKSARPHSDRCAQLRAERFAVKGLDRCNLPLRTQSEVDGVAIPVDGAIQVDPAANGPSDRAFFRPLLDTLRFSSRRPICGEI
jgi:hypothetical protein